VLVSLAPDPDSPGGVRGDDRTMKGTPWRVVEWLGGHELTVILGLLTVFAGTWGFVALAGKVVEGDTQRFDERIIRSLRHADDPAKPIGPPWLEEVGRDITALGGVALLVLVTGSVAGFLALDGKFGAMWFVLGATTSGCALGVALKALFRRPRPEVVPHLMRAYSSSFPSGHSMMSAVVYLTLGVLLVQLVSRRRLKFYFLTQAVILTGLVGVSRVYMGVHYPTDVLAGWTAGMVWAALCWLVQRALQRRGQVEQQI
jgi:undecaprenyl-diphosphatase